MTTATPSIASTAEPAGAARAAPEALRGADGGSAAGWLAATAAQSLALNFVADVAAQRDDGGFDLDAGGTRLTATLAASCALQPEPGDRVACWRVAEGGAAEGRERVYVLAVLERRAAGPARWRLAAGAELKAGDDGALQLQATREIGLAAPALHAQADQVRLHAGSGSFVFRTLDTIGEAVSTTVGQLRLVGQMLSTVFDRQVHHAGQHTRTTDGVDRVQAPVIQQQAGTLLQLQGENVLANGERVVKMQGAQIHLG